MQKALKTMAIWRLRVACRYMPSDFKLEQGPAVTSSELASSDRLSLDLAQRLLAEANGRVRH